MLKFLFNLAQLFVIYWVTCKVLKYTVFRRFNKARGKYGKKRMSLLGKVWLLISRQLHSSLDGMLKRQSNVLREKKKNLEEKPAIVTQQSSNGKVIQFKKYQRKVVK
jgi:hypothetical protein